MAEHTYIAGLTQFGGGNKKRRKKRKPGLRQSLRAAERDSAGNRIDRRSRRRATGATKRAPKAPASKRRAAAKAPTKVRAPRGGGGGRA